MVKNWKGSAHLRFWVYILIHGYHGQNISGQQKKSVKKVINVMRCLTGREWGASCSALKKMYVAMIRSALDYGCITYGSAARSLLGKLDVIQAQVLRVYSGAFKTSPIPALQVSGVN